MKRNTFRSALCLLLCLSLVLMSLPAAAAAETGTKRFKRSRIIVSLGDSYASGEGIEPFYGQNGSMASRVSSEDWLAHRSEKSWSGMLTLPSVDGPMSKHRGTNWYFVASSGATTEHIKRTGDKVVDKDTGRREGEQTKEYDRDGLKGHKNLPGQLDVFYETEGLDRFDVDYVTLSVGGNDVHFADIIMEAHHTILSTSMYDYINRQLVGFYLPGGTYDKLHAAYRRVVEAAPNATILVTGYPELLDYDGKGPAFNILESTYINAAVRIFNGFIESLVEECKREGLKIEFVSVEKAFEGHQAYSDDNYINSVMYLYQDQDLKGFPNPSAYSMHPNEKGARAYARCVQARIDELEAIKAENMPVRETSRVRNVVLVLDNSGSMGGTPLTETKKAAKEFVRTVLREDAGVAIVTYSDNALLRTDFSMDEGYLLDLIDRIYDQNNTNTEAGLKMAKDLLDKTSDSKKIIVLMSDGAANVGKTGDELTKYAQQLREEEGIIIYTIGFFQYFSGYDLRSVQRSMEGIASDACHFEADKADNLVFFFGDIADQINGQPYVYIRIACPVDVEVSLGDEKLSSVSGTTRTSFGTLTFEAGEGRGSDNRTKILRLREDGNDYQVSIRGNGEGTMHYTTGFVDDNGQYTDLREFEDVAITASTVATANATRGSATVLKVDDDGDGRFDHTFSVGGPAVSPALIIFLVLGGLLLAGAAVLLPLLLRRRRIAAASAGTVPGTDAGVTVLMPGNRYAAAAKAVPEPAAPAEGPICASCGAKLRSTSKFCNVCGKAVLPAVPDMPPAPTAESAPTAEPAPATPAEAAEPAGRVCGKCGARLNGTAVFCNRCGTRL